MTTSIFADKSKRPEDRDLSAALAEAKALWDGLKGYLANSYGNIQHDWMFYSRQSGWTLVIRHHNRTLFYLYPCAGFFKVLFVFGEKAAAAAVNSALPDPILDTIRKAEPHVEGRSFWVEVRERGDLEHIKELVAIKMTH